MERELFVTIPILADSRLGNLARKGFEQLCYDYVAINLCFERRFWKYHDKKSARKPVYQS